MELVVSTKSLTRSFGKRRAVDSIDLSVPKGSVFGFLGPNGSGKTTTIRLLLGLIKADSGSVEVLGQAMPQASGKVLPQVGALVEGPAFLPYLTGEQNLTRLQAMDATDNRATARDRRAEALERVGLTKVGRKRYRQYSLGMKQRLGIAAALMKPHQLLVLDEPTNGLDPQGTREIRTLIRELHAEGATVVLSSHLLSEVEQVCTDVGVMSRGKLVTQQPLAGLQQLAAPTLRVEVTEATAQLAAGVLTGIGLKFETTGPVGFQIDLGERETPQVVRLLVEAGVGLAAVVPGRRSLEEAFVELTGAGFDVAGWGLC